LKKIECVSSSTSVVTVVDALAPLVRVAGVPYRGTTVYV
jgi:hypothetical protein